MVILCALGWYILHANDKNLNSKVGYLKELALEDTIFI